MEVNVANLTLETVDSSTGAVIYSKRGFLAGPATQGLDSNALHGDGTYGYNIGGQNTFMVDGDLIVSVAWTQGFQLMRIADDGSVTRIWQDTAAMGTLGTELAVDTVNHKAYGGGYYGTGTGLTEYDYSAFVAGGAGPGVVVATHTTSNSNIPTNGGWGYPYLNGIYMVGDWIYFSRYVAGAGANVERWNPSTDTAETLPVTNGTGNVYRGGFTYDADNDRLFQGSYTGSGRIYIIDGASTASPNVVACETNVGSSGTNNALSFMYVDGNYVTFCGYSSGYRVMTVDITTPLTGTSSTPDVVTDGSENRITDLGMVVGPSTHRIYKIDGLDYPFFSTGRDDVSFGGWIDLEDNTIVAPPVSYAEAASQPLDFLRTSYGFSWKKITSNSGTRTTYWVWAGYGGDGYFIHTFPDGAGPELENSWDVTFGPYALDSGANVRSALVNMPGMKTPSGCTLSLSASNNGTDFVSITEGTQFDFVTAGSAVYVKVEGAGTDVKSAYVKDVVSQPTVVMLTESTEYPSIRTLMRLAGKEAA